MKKYKNIYFFGFDKRDSFHDTEEDAKESALRSPDYYITYLYEDNMLPQDIRFSNKVRTKEELVNDEPDHTGKKRLKVDPNEITDEEWEFIHNMEIENE